MSVPGGKLGELRMHWRGLACATMAVGVGATLFSYTATFFILPIQAESGWSRGEVASGMTFFMVGNAAALPFAGGLTDRLGVRMVGPLALGMYGLLCLALAFFPLEQALFYLLFALTGIVCAGTSGIVFSPFVAQRFDHARGLALGIMMSGAAAILVPFNRLLVALIEEAGWRSGFVALGLAAIGLGIPAALFATRRPLAHAAEQAGEATGMSLAEAARTGTFWKIIFALACSALAIGGFLNQLSPILVARGVSTGTTAWLMSLFVTMVIVGRISVGAMMDSFPPPVIAAGVMICAGAGASLLMFQEPLILAFTIAVMLQGGALGAIGNIQPFFISRYFGLRNFATLFGVSATFSATCLGLGALLFGATFDMTGDYDLALLLAMGLLVTAGLGFGSVGLGRSRAFESSENEV